jgi:c-di-GMP-binding flagellar brake protein YcgR
VELEHAPGSHEHRYDPRTQVSRAARFMLLQHPERGWGSCRLVDVSRGGAGLVLFGPPWPRYRSERHLFIRLDADEATGDRLVPYLEVVVRNTCVTEAGWLRAGVEFVVVTTSQQRAVDEWLRLLRRET